MPIDLRSDTVTRPTAGMRAAMAQAEVGDDVFGDDPTVNHLQATLAGRLGFEAGLFFPSGTQSNLAALMSHCERGDEYLVGQEAHTLGGGMRQAGVLAAAGLYALEHHVVRLAEDHENAARLARGLQEVPGLTVEPPQTNLVWVTVEEPLVASFVRGLAQQGVLATGRNQVRFVTHLDVRPEDIDTVIAAARKVVAGG
ncbi:MAG: hypothetical protein IT380_00880 [Myxococcales bacterium]|nr:hypothetical protein [Myxococcales bacterium]